MRRTIILLVLVLLFTQRAQASLVGYWDFNEGLGTIAHDVSGNGNVGTLASRAVTWTEGKYGYGLDFSGGYLTAGNDYDQGRVVVPDSDSLDLANSFTISAWVKPNAMGGPKNIVSKFTSGGDVSYSFKQDNNTTKWRIELYPDGGVIGADLKSNTDITLNEWHYLTMTYDSVNLGLWIDGQLDNSLAYSDSVYEGNSPLIIGGIDQGWANPFSGVIDEVRIYNNALSQGEILRDMTATPEPFSGLLLIAGIVIWVGVRGLRPYFLQG